MSRTRTGPTPVELTLLGMLTEGAAHPYALDAKLREQGAPTDVAFSSIYAALARLATLGVVTSRTDGGLRGKARRVYRLTPAGRSLLKASVRDALAKPLVGSRPNELGIGNLTLLRREDALAAIVEARSALSDERRRQPSLDGSYPQGAVLLHRAMLVAAEERFYIELERIVQRSHRDGRQKTEEVGLSSWPMPCRCQRLSSTTLRSDAPASGPKSSRLTPRSCRSR